MTERCSLTSNDIGGPGPADPSACAAHAITLLCAASGEGMRMTSLEMDVTSNPVGDERLDVVVKVDKRAKSILFASVEARAGDQLVFRAQGLFGRLG